MCPYARFQSVLLDSHSLLVGYDPLRGEPRRPLKKAASTEPAGDCVDCGLCVKVCPTGIDIRNGLQLECVQCASCIDACDSIMAKVGRSAGLIRYDTEEGLLEKPRRFMRPRVLLYGAGLLILGGAFVALLSTRALVDASIARGARDHPFMILDDGRISNHMHLHLTNKGTVPDAYTVEVLSPAAVEVIVPGAPVPIAADTDRTVPLFFNFHPELLAGGRLVVRLRITGKHGFIQELEVGLLGPG